jgi:hypothetical protein
MTMLVPIIEEASSEALSRHMHEVYRSYSLSTLVALAVLAYLVILGSLGIVTWLWIVRAVRRQQSWARAAVILLWRTGEGRASTARLTLSPAASCANIGRHEPADIAQARRDRVEQVGSAHRQDGHSADCRRRGSSRRAGASAG